MKTLTITFISLYQYLEPLRHSFYTAIGIPPQSCRYRPSCSQFTKNAVREYGTIHGLSLGFKRLLTCHPFHHQSGQN